MQTARGCSTNLQKLNHAATSNLSVVFWAKEAPMANSAPGVAADPNIITKSLIGPGRGQPLADHNNRKLSKQSLGFSLVQLVLDKK